MTVFVGIYTCEAEERAVMLSVITYANHCLSHHIKQVGWQLVGGKAQD